MSHNKQNRWLPWLALFALAGCLSATAGDGLGRCATVESPGRVLLPDGTLHTGQSLTLCFERVWVPGSGLHEIRVDGAALGQYRSRIGQSAEDLAGEPFVLFERDADGTHRLIGYAWPNREGVQTYRLVGIEQRLTRAERRASLFAAASGHGEVVRLAARVSR